MIARPLTLRTVGSATKAARRTISNANSTISSSRPLLTQPRKQNRIPASYYRGGTSRGLIFNVRDLPSEAADWDAIFRGTLGSPDPNGRQLDGLGGGISSLSKICVVGPAQRPDADVAFTFVQVGIKDGAIDYSGNCGNLMAAIGPYAVDSGIISLKDRQESATVRIYNTNTDKIVESTFPVRNGEAATAHGDLAIDGVAGTGAKIRLDFLDPAGSKTGRMFPTGSVVDVIDGVRTTCVDVGNPCIFLLAEELGIDGTMLPDATAQTPGLLEKLERIRAQAAVKMGMAATLDAVPASIPKVCFVSPPRTHRLLSGEEMQADKVDIVTRAISVGQPHKALPITAGLAMSAAAGVAGTVVQECYALSRRSPPPSPSSSSASCASRRSNSEDELVIGHASGKLDVGAKFVNGELERVTVFRTARRLMEGTVFWK
ncbi:hypothetical protein VTO42DRAFT_7613 [Malbranchea cinnamomea]